MNSELPWSWSELSDNQSIPWQIVQAHPDEPWDWANLSRNQSITWEIVQAHPDKPWDWANLSRHPSISWEIVQAHPDKPWDWEYVSAFSDFQGLGDVYTLERLRRSIACVRIQRWWIRR